MRLQSTSENFDGQAKQIWRIWVSQVQCKIFIYVTPDADEVLNALLLLLLLEIFEDEIELLGEDEDDFIVVIASAVGQLSQRISGVRITSYYEEIVLRYF